jgi:hypothetical protein
MEKAMSKDELRRVIDDAFAKVIATLRIETDEEKAIKMVQAVEDECLASIHSLLLQGAPEDEEIGECNCTDGQACKHDVAEERNERNALLQEHIKKVMGE